MNDTRKPAWFWPAIVAGVMATAIVVVSGFFPAASQDGGPVIVGHPVSVDPPQAPISTPLGTTVVPTPGATANTTVTTTGPVTSDTKISIGTYAGQALQWMLVAFAAPLGTLLVGIFYKIAQRIGFSLDEAYRQRLEEGVTNALHAVAPKTGAMLAGRMQVDVKNKAVADSIKYVAANLPDTLKKLGIDPTTDAGKQVIEARIEKVLNDPTIPTPASVTPPSNTVPAIAPAV